MTFGAPADVAEVFAAYAEMGFSDIVVRTMTTDADLAVETIEAMAEVRAELAS